jgi:hypothetical protein
MWENGRWVARTSMPSTASTLLLVDTNDTNAIISAAVSLITGNYSLPEMRAAGIATAQRFRIYWSPVHGSTSCSSLSATTGPAAASYHKGACGNDLASNNSRGKYPASQWLQPSMVGNEGQCV